MSQKKNGRYALVAAVGMLALFISLASASTALASNDDALQNRERIQTRTRTQDGDGPMNQIRHRERVRNQEHNAENPDGQIELLSGVQDRLRNRDRDGVRDYDRIRNRLRLQECLLEACLIGGLWH